MASGVALSVIGLVSLVSTGIDLFEIVACAKHFKDDAKVLLCRLHLEQIRILIFGEQMKRESPIDFPPHIGHLRIKEVVIETLEAVNSLFDDSSGLTSRYGLQKVTTNDNAEVRTLDSGTEELTPLLDVGHQLKKLLRRQSGRFSGAAKQARKVQWAIVDKDRFKDLVADLAGINDSLRGLLSDAQALVLDRRISTEARTLECDSMDLSVLAAATSETEFETLASRVRVQTTVRATSERLPPRGTLKISRERINMDRLPLHASRTISTYSARYGDEIPVLLEWISYHGSTARNWREKSVIRATHLVCCLREAWKEQRFRTLECVGFFTEEAGHNESYQTVFVYQIPSLSSSPNDTLMASLKTLIDNSSSAPRSTQLSSTPRPRSPTPHLDDRFALARTLVSSLQYFLSTGWLHRAIRSDNIQFFYRDTEARKRNPLDNPFLTGFESARPDDPDEYSYRADSDMARNRYRHPDYVVTERQSFLPRYDVYSLGVILFEIGMWKTVDSLPGVPAMSIQDFHTTLAATFATSLGYMCGRVYRDVVVFCLTGDFASASVEEETSDFLAIFAQRVMQPLYELHV